MFISFKMARNSGLIIMVVIIGMMGIFSFLNTARIMNHLRVVIKEKTPVLEKIVSIREDFLRAVEIFVTFSRREREDADWAMVCMDKAIEKTTALNKMVPEKDRDEVVKFITAAKRFKMAVIVYAKEIKIDPTGSSTLDMEKLAMATAWQTNAVLTNMINDIRASIKASDISTFIAAKKNQNSILVIMFVGVTAGFVVAFFMRKALMKPIKQLVDATQYIAQGDLTYRISTTTKDEIMLIFNAFNKMAENLNVYMQKEKELVTTAEIAVEDEKKKTLELAQENAERKKAEEELKNAYTQLKAVQSQLLQSSKMASLGQLAGGVAHEINNPLTGVLNNTQLIKLLAEQKKDFNINDFMELLDVIESSAQRCKDITQSLLDFSHISTSIFQKFSLNEAIGQVIDLVGHEIRLQNIHIQTDLDKDLPQISGNSQLLQQVVLDLINNARWAIQQKSEQEAGVIAVKTKYNSAKKTADLYISDTGIGIPKENLDKIFEPFFTTKPVGEGTGLGLSVVYGIIKEHKGSIEAESDIAKGSLFKISLPLVTKQEA